MKKLDRVVVPLRVLLVLLFAGLIVGQVMSLPGEFSHMAAQAPELGYVPWVLLTITELQVVCLQVVIVCIWRLLTLVRADRIFSEGAFVWVDAIMWAMAAAWALFIGLFLFVSSYLYLTPELRDPGLPILLFGMVLIVGVVVLTIVVLRALLRQAAALRADMEEVI